MKIPVQNIPLDEADVRPEPTPENLEYGKAAEPKAKLWLESIGYKEVKFLNSGEQEKDKIPDLVVYHNKKILFYLEVERARKWLSRNFPTYWTPHIVGGKKGLKQFRPLRFIQFRADMRSAIIYTSRWIDPKYYKRWDNCKKKNEGRYDVFRYENVDIDEEIRQKKSNKRTNIFFPTIHELKDEDITIDNFYLAVYQYY